MPQTLLNLEQSATRIIKPAAELLQHGFHSNCYNSFLPIDTKPCQSQQYCSSSGHILSGSSSRCFSGSGAEGDRSLCFAVSVHLQRLLYLKGVWRPPSQESNHHAGGTQEIRITGMVNVCGGVSANIHRFKDTDVEIRSKQTLNIFKHIFKNIFGSSISFTNAKNRRISPALPNLWGRFVMIRIYIWHFQELNTYSNLGDIVLAFPKTAQY